MDNTIIKISVKNLHSKENNLIKKIYEKTKKNFDIIKYKACYNGNIEEGYKITFFNTLNKYRLIFLHDLFKKLFSDYGCYYIENEHFKGCIKEYLFNKGCEVKGTYKQKYSIH